MSVRKRESGVVKKRNHKSVEVQQNAAMQIVCCRFETLTAHAPQVLLIFSLRAYLLPEALLNLSPSNIN